MHISWYGQSCFKIQTKDITLILDPFGKEIGLKPPRFKADILCISHDHFDHNNISSVSGHPFVISGPGEYEIKKVFCQGIPTFHDKKHGTARGLNTVYLITLEEIRICHLGDLGHELSDEQLDKINGIDILMIPVGEVYTFNLEEAIKTINKIEPRIVIPMHYKIPGLKVKLSPLDNFLDKLDVKKKPIDKLLIKKKDLLEEKTEVVVLKCQSKKI